VDVDHVNVLDEPVVTIPDTQEDPVSLANHAAVAAGVTVVVGSGGLAPSTTSGPRPLLRT